MVQPIPAPVWSIKFEALGRAKAPIEFGEGGPMRPLRRSRDAQMTTTVSSSEEDEELQAILTAKAPIEFVERSYAPVPPVARTPIDHRRLYE